MEKYLLVVDIYVGLFDTKEHLYNMTTTAILFQETGHFSTNGTLFRLQIQAKGRTLDTIRNKHRKKWHTWSAIRRYYQKSFKIFFQQCLYLSLQTSSYII